MHGKTLENTVNSKNNQQEDAVIEKTEESVLNAFKRYKSVLKYYISSYVVNSQDVDDVCQETFLRTYKSSLENEVLKPKSFMFRVAKNLIVSDFRKVNNSNRLFANYKQAISWSEVFLMNKSFTNFSGNSKNMAILFPMERIFEDYKPFVLNYTL